MGIKRLVKLPTTRADNWVWRRLAKKSKTHEVVVLTTRRPAELLLKGVEQADGEAEGIYVVDATPRATPPTQNGRVFSGLSMENVEQLAMRTIRVAKTPSERPRFYVIDALDPLAALMAPEALAEMGRRVVADMDRPDSTHEWYYADLPPSVEQAATLLVDEHVEAATLG